MTFLYSFFILVTETVYRGCVCPKSSLSMRAHVIFFFFLGIGEETLHKRYSGTPETPEGWVLSPNEATSRASNDKEQLFNPIGVDFHSGNIH